MPEQSVAILSGRRAVHQEGAAARRSQPSIPANKDHVDKDHGDHKGHVDKDLSENYYVDVKSASEKLRAERNARLVGLYMFRIQSETSDS